MCQCLDAVNAVLAEHNGCIEFNMLADPPRAMIAISKVKSKGKKPPLMEAAFCPFCGDKYSERGPSILTELTKASAS